MTSYKRDWLHTSVFAVILIFVASTMFVVVRGYFDCKADDGKYVRGMFLYECLERNE